MMFPFLVQEVMEGAVGEIGSVQTAQVGKRPMNNTAVAGGAVTSWWSRCLRIVCWTTWLCAVVMLCAATGVFGNRDADACSVVQTSVLTELRSLMNLYEASARGSYEPLSVERLLASGEVASAIPTDGGYIESVGGVFRHSRKMRIWCGENGSWPETVSEFWGAMGVARLPVANDPDFGVKNLWIILDRSGNCHLMYRGYFLSPMKTPYVSVCTSGWDGFCLDSNVAEFGVENDGWRAYCPATRNLWRTFIEPERHKRKACLIVGATACVCWLAATGLVWMNRRKYRAVVVQVVIASLVVGAAYVVRYQQHESAMDEGVGTALQFRAISANAFRQEVLDLRRCGIVSEVQVEALSQASKFFDEFRHNVNDPGGG